MSKRVWIRTHALTFLADAVARMGDFEEAQRIRNERSDRYRENDPNEMVVVTVGDEAATAMGKDVFLFTAGKVLADGERPPSVGADADQRGR